MGANDNTVKKEQKDISQIKCSPAIKKTLLKEVSPKFKKRAKKLVLVLTTSTPVTGNREEIGEALGAGKNDEESKDGYPENLAQVLYIRYPITFWKKSVPMSALFDSSSEINTIHPSFA